MRSIQTKLIIILYLYDADIVLAEKKIHTANFHNAFILFSSANTNTSSPKYDH